MKNLLVFILIFICLFCLNLNSSNTLYELFSGSADVSCLITDNEISSANSSVKSGNSYINYLTKGNDFLLKNSQSKVYGETVIFNNENLQFVIKKLQLNIVSFVKQNNVIELLGYTNKLNNFVLVNNNLVNIQIVVLNNKMVVGYPLILQGF